MPRPGSIAIVAVLGCTGGGAPVPAPSPAPPRAAAAHEHAAAVPAGAPGDTAGASSALLEGRRIVESVCFACHTAGPPAKAAPPFRMIAMRYRQATPDSAAAVARIVAFIRDPAAERSLLAAGVVRRFGVMPALALPESDLRKAAAYVLSLEHRPTGGMRHGGEAPGRR